MGKDSFPANILDSTKRLILLSTILLSGINNTKHISGHRPATVLTNDEKDDASGEDEADSGDETDDRAGHSTSELPGWHGPAGQVGAGGLGHVGRRQSQP